MLKELKNSVLNVYGLTKNTATNEYMLVFDEFYGQRSEYKGRCANCNRNNTSEAWCQVCDLQKATQGWTSGNKDVDDCINEFQLKATKYEEVIEWIPFNRLDNVQMIGKGGFVGFGTVFSATWLDGKRVVSGKAVNSYTQSRTSSCVVALKTLPGSQKNFKRSKLMGYNLEVYGITQNTTNNEYLLVFQYADRGNLHDFLSLNFKELNWKSKLKQLVDISKNLIKIHKAEYVHGDFHSGNILQNQYINGDLISYIADLGLSRKMDDSDLEDSVYGVLPYVAPELFNKHSYTVAADIYSFGIIMTKMSTERPPHFDIKYDETLVVKICSGLRPEFAKGTPECYIQLANHCMDADPSNRPTASDIYDKLSGWYKILNNGSAENNDELTILKEFQSADSVIPTLSTELPICSKDELTSNIYDKLSEWYKILNNSGAENKDELGIIKSFQPADSIIPTLSNELLICYKDKLTSKLLNFKNLSKPINSLSTELLKTYDE
ncbi:kinase-like domain-containing protein [Gigaspora rosea]|uniref:Kinase-like domain-containing protein n=1 Tax=Gigaspora rosea TaxID=44941 RepID=A0A397TZR2_9GLOM|nr:kinase-like domain-containing protein [Gigaspora rosea]